MSHVCSNFIGFDEVLVREIKFWGHHPHSFRICINARGCDWRFSILGRSCDDHRPDQVLWVELDYFGHWLQDSNPDLGVLCDWHSNVDSFELARQHFSLSLFFHLTGICLSHSDRCFRFIKRASMTRSLVTLCGLMCWTKIGIFHEWSKNQFQCVQVDRFLFWSWTWKFLDVNGKWTLFFKAMKIEHFVLLKNRQKTLGTFGQFYVWRIQKLFYL